MLVRNGKSHYVTEFTTYKLHRLIVRCIECLHNFFLLSHHVFFLHFFFSFGELMLDLFISSCEKRFLFHALGRPWLSFHSRVRRAKIKRSEKLILYLLMQEGSLAHIDRSTQSTLGCLRLVHNLRYKQQLQTRRYVVPKNEKQKTRKLFDLYFMKLMLQRAHRPRHRHRRTIHELLRKNTTTEQKT